MAELNVDTARMRDCGNTIMTLANEIGMEYNNIFDKLVAMPTTTFEWVGKAAEAYANNMSKERFQYIEFKDNLYKYGKYLVESADVLEARAREI